MSNQNDNDWLKNIKAVKTWTADTGIRKSQWFSGNNFSYRKRKERSNWNYKGYRCPRWD